MFETTEFWVFAAFALFVIAVFKPVGKAVSAGLDSHADKIRGELDEARRLREEAQATLASYERRQRDALKEAENIIAHAREEADRIRQQAMEQMNEVMARREEQVLDKIAQMEEDARAEIRNLSVDIAMSTSRDILAEKISKSQHMALIDESIGALPEKLN